MLVERTRAEMARARAEGKTLGRPEKTTPDQRETMKERAAAGGSTLLWPETIALMLENQLPEGVWVRFPRSVMFSEKRSVWQGPSCW